MTLIYPVILNEVKNPELFLPLLAGFFTSFRMTVKSKDVIPKPQIKQVLYLNGDDINLPCHSERSEESHKSLLPQSLRFFTSFRMTVKSKDVIGNEVRNLTTPCYHRH